MKPKVVFELEELAPAQAGAARTVQENEGGRRESDDYVELTGSSAASCFGAARDDLRSTGSERKCTHI